jgi:hypothetical protein
MHTDTNTSEKLAALEGISAALHHALQEMLETLRASKPGEAGREFSVRLTIDLPDSLPGAIRPPDRTKQVGPAPAHRVRIAGMTWEYPVVAVAQVVATVTVFGSRGETPPTGMHRGIWFLPVENDETRERRAQEQRSRP